MEDRCLNRVEIDIDIHAFIACCRKEFFPNFFSPPVRTIKHIVCFPLVIRKSILFICKQIPNVLFALAR